LQGGATCQHMFSGICSKRPLGPEELALARVSQPTSMSSIREPSRVSSQPGGPRSRIASAARQSPLDPYTGPMSSFSANFHMMAGRYDEAAALARRALEEWQSPAAYRIAAACTALAGRSTDVRKLADLFRQLDPVRRVSNLLGRMCLVPTDGPLTSSASRRVCASLDLLNDGTAPPRRHRVGRCSRYSRLIGRDETGIEGRHCCALASPGHRTGEVLS